MKEFFKAKMSEINSLPDSFSTEDLKSDDNHEKEDREKLEQSKQLTNVRSGKVITNALCTLIQVSESINGRLQTIQNATTEINLLRQEVVAMTQKLDRLIAIAEKSPEGGSTFMKYLLS